MSVEIKRKCDGCGKKLTAGVIDNDPKRIALFENECRAETEAFHYIITVQMKNIHEDLCHGCKIRMIIAHLTEYERSLDNYKELRG